MYSRDKLWRTVSTHGRNSSQQHGEKSQSEALASALTWNLVLTRLLRSWRMPPDIPMSLRSRCLPFCLCGALALPAAPSAQFEAEKTRLTREAEVIALPSASAGAAVRVPDKGGLLEWTFDVAVPGRYEITLRYRSDRDVSAILSLNGRDWGVGLVRAAECWGECQRTFSLNKGVNHLSLRSDYGEILVDQFSWSHDTGGAPEPVYELPALSPRNVLSYAKAPRTLGFKLELNGHQMIETTIDGRPAKAEIGAFGAIPDTVRLLLPAPELAQLQPGVHQMECRMEDGSVARAVIQQETAPRAAPFSILSVDVGHGKATLLCLPNGEIALVDTGTAEAAATTLIPLLKRQCIHRIDHLILTHHHDDHDGGVPQLQAEFEIGASMDNTSVKTGDRLHIGGADVLVLNASDAGTDENSRSLALRWTYGKFSYSDGADNYAGNQQAVMTRFPNEIRADVYYTNHHLHGSTDVNFLRKTDASLYLISAQEAVYARGAYSQQFKGLVETHLRSAGARLKESLLSYDVGHVLIRVREDGSWTYECYRTADPIKIDALTPREWGSGVREVHVPARRS